MQKYLNVNYLKLTKSKKKYLFFKFNGDFKNENLKLIGDILEGLEKISGKEINYDKLEKSFIKIEKAILLKGKSYHKDKNVVKVAKDILKYNKISDILNDITQYNAFLNDEIYTNSTGLLVSYNYYKNNRPFFNNTNNTKHTNGYGV